MTAPKDMSNLKVLVIDVGGTHVKVLATGQTEERKIPSGPNLTPGQMVSQVKRLTKDWEYEAISIGYPGPVIHGLPLRTEKAENLAARDRKTHVAQRLAVAIAKSERVRFHGGRARARRCGSRR